MNSRMMYFVRALILYLVFSPLITSAANKDEAIDFNIKAQSVSAALQKFSTISGIDVGYSADMARDVTSSAVSGKMTPTQALKQLLSDTGIVGNFTDDNTVELEASQGQDTKQKTVVNGEVATLETVQVSGAVIESAYGPVDGYAATRSATATKTDTLIRDVPGSIQVVSREVIDDQRAFSLKDVYENVSGVQQSGNTQNAQSEVFPIIRGFESPVMLRNGMRTTSAGAVDLINVERVEVLKGPASILYGSLEPGGIINYVTKRPQAETSHSVDVEYGSEDFKRIAIDTTGAVNESESLLYRFNAAYTDSNSFRDHMDLERTAIASSLLWKITDNTELLVDLSYLNEKQPYDTGIPLDENGKPLVKDDTFFNDPDLAGRDINDVTASYQLDHKFNDHFRVRNQFQYHRAHALNETLRPLAIGFFGFPELQIVHRYQNEDRVQDEYQFVLDMIGNFELGPTAHEVLFGAESIRQDSDFSRFRTGTVFTAISNNPEVNFDPPSNQPQDVRLASTDRVGFYLQDQMSLLDGRLKLLFGGRYDDLHQENKRNDVSSPEVDEDAFTGRVGILYDLTEHLSTYASVSQSFTPQSSGTVDKNGNLLDPEEGLQYEIGFKTSLFNDKLISTLAFYHIEKKNVAAFDQEYFNATGLNASFPGVRERSRGIDFDISGALTDQIKVIANYSLTDTAVLENPDEPESVGEPLGGVPLHRARVWLTYDFDKAGPLNGLGIGGGVRYVGQSTAKFDTTLKLDSYTVTDLALWYHWQDFAEFSLNVKNVFDKRYIDRAATIDLAHPGAPLAVYGAVKINF